MKQKEEAEENEAEREFREEMVWLASLVTELARWYLCQTRREREVTDGRNGNATAGKGNMCWVTSRLMWLIADWCHQTWQHQNWIDLTFVVVGQNHFGRISVDQHFDLESSHFCWSCHLCQMASF